VVATQPEEPEHPQIVNISQSSVEMIQAGLVRANQTNIRHLEADEVDLQVAAAGRIETSGLQVRDSAIGVVSSSQASVVDSIAGGIRSDTLNFNGVAALAVANNFTGKDVSAFTIIATDLKADTIHTGILISREVHGNVTTTVDAQSALMAGLVGGLTTGLVLMVAKLLFGRNK
jgi:hypothetical protein